MLLQISQWIYKTKCTIQTGKPENYVFGREDYLYCWRTKFVPGEKEVLTNVRRQFSVVEVIFSERYQIVYVCFAKMWTKESLSYPALFATEARNAFTVLRFLTKETCPTLCCQIEKLVYPTCLWYKQYISVQEYDAGLDPSISNVFATAAFRFGHTLISPVMRRLSANFTSIPGIDLHDRIWGVATPRNSA